MTLLKWILEQDIASNEDQKQDEKPQNSQHEKYQKKFHIFQEEIKNKCMDLGMDLKSFERGNNGQLEWFDLCFYICFQYQICINTSKFPMPLPKKKKDLWKRKKEKEILDLFEFKQYKSLYAQEIGQLKKTNSYKWCLLTDFFVSEIQEIVLTKWKRKQQHTTTTTTTTESTSSTSTKTSTVSKEEIIELTQEIMNCFSTRKTIQEKNKTNNLSDKELTFAIQICTQKLEQQQQQQQAAAKKSCTTIKQKAPSLIDKSSLTAQDLTKLEKVNEMLRQDFKMRRELMIERCDVTLQSFLWSERGKQNEKDMLEEFHQAKSNISSEPVHIELTTLYNASVEELSELFHQKQILEEGSSLRNILIGQVPDRGGRTTDLKEKDLQKALKDPWTSSSSRNNKSSHSQYHQKGPGGRNKTFYQNNKKPKKQF